VQDSAIKPGILPTAIGIMDELKYYFTIFICLVLGTVFAGCGSKGAVLYDQNTKSEINEYIS
jgi:hypothetical protein